MLNHNILACPSPVKDSPSGGCAKDEHGFTIAEFLIVLVIIAVLGGILFTSFAPARGRSRQSVCASNLRQLHAALTIYRNDYDGDDPVVGMRPTCDRLGLPCGLHSYGYFFGSLKNPGVLRCPDSLPSERSPWTYAPSFLFDHPLAMKNEQAAIERLGAKAPVFSCYDHSTVATREMNRYDKRRVIYINFNGEVTNKMFLRDDAYYPFQ
jgi:prepilin-type N-terminal cleavage/methylation domain-containing protein